MNVDVANFLNSKLQEIRQRNPRFSMRAFSKKVNISSGRVSELLNGQRPLSRYYADRISKGLQFDESETREIMSLVTTPGRKVFSDRELSEHEMALMTSWEHYAVLNLLNLDDFESDPIWMAQRLGVTVQQILRSLQILSNLELIKFEDGRYVRNVSTLTTTQDIPSDAIQTSLLQHMQKAASVLKQTPVELRDYSFSTMTIDPSQLQKAKELIESFHDRLSLLLESGKKTEVYGISLQLYPITLPKEKKP